MRIEAQVNSELAFQLHLQFLQPPFMHPAKRILWFAWAFHAVGWWTAACVLPFIVVFLFLIASPFIIAGKSFGFRMETSHGMLLGSAFNGAWVVLLSGLILNANHALAVSLNSTNWWSSSILSAYNAAYAFAYIVTGTFIIVLCCCLYVSYQLGADWSEALPAPNSQIAGSAELGAAVPAPPSSWPPPPPTQGAPAVGPPSSWPPKPSQPGAPLTTSNNGAWGGRTEF
ncbi:hypothetical protein CEUSTIGMA_g8163.t1 [Chlamydomonas eustigma]|uniref:Uncharacterized protein n=1 Tax=Chlamydomonas eustigma TaxID=1157962 RepID=A0A250XCC2_9CHLO|nr:hypothetical protein CEUSTIGMA_g8163.t1 [Chlamydomonas eustigma]|eukprot:GAX80728.1 hypothetical protein CEUSTIGMA_g8163.t1 [Chlamydomonas eustigma]